MSNESLPIKIFTRITEQEKLLPFYILGAGVQKNQEHTIRPEGFPCYQWTYCTKGKGLFTIDNKTYTIEKGMGFYFAPNIPHSYYAIVEPWETHWVIYEGSHIPSLLSLFHIGSWEIFTLDEEAPSLSLYHAIYKELEGNNLDKIINTSPMLYNLLIELKNSKKLSHAHPKKWGKLQPVIRYMEQHPHEDIALDTLAALIGVTTHHLCKLFKSAFGISPIHYLIRIRLQIAKELLVKSPQLKIGEVAKKVGYQDTSYFCTIFKRQEKMTPLAFRRLHGI